MIMDDAREGPVSHPRLTLRLELRSGPPRPTGVVVLANEAGADARVWRPGNRWGDTALSFEVEHDGRVGHITRREQVYTINVPRSFVLPEGSSHALPFDLGDGEWEAEIPIDQLIVPEAQLVAVFDVPPSPEAMEHGVWIGQLRSDPVLLRAAGPESSKPD